MGTGEEGTPTKPPAKPPTSTSNQETPTTPAYPDWAAAFQAYYGAGATPPPPAFFASTVGTAPTPHPYMWGGQPLMPPYGTPLPYPAMYPPGGIYAHPSMPPGALPYAHYGMPSPGNAEVTTAAALANAEAEAKSSEGKDKNTMKRSKGSLGSLGMITGKGGEKATSGSANEAGSQSGESGSDGSSEGSEEDNAQNESQVARKRSFDQMIVDGANAQNNVSTYNTQTGEPYMNSSGHAMGNPIGQTVALPLVPVTGKPATSGPITNLNIGMDYWNASAAGAITTVKARGNTTGIPTAIVPTTAQLMPAGREGVPPELWIQDERELKRQRRKQSNRESARRSRLRKQAECEELASKVESLTIENMNLRSELTRLAEECKKLTQDNASMMEQLNKLHGEDTTTASEENGPTKIGLQSVKAEGNGHYHDISRGINSNSSERNEQKQSEKCDSNGKLHTLLDANVRSDTG
uniref:TSA: Wollemia nobilis Ref_Wollemi_Transcript_10978_2763 transcribed RNA sequence n=1 Tax=Wollemia nobilis TaxID=56998 RepID=A0A0C9QT24_9CONI